MQKIVCIIPARLGSYRFMDKPLALICGKPMIEHVYKRAKLADLLSEVYVATPDEKLKKIVESFGGEVILTDNNARRASDRVAQAAAGLDADIIVDLQGDEPLVNPQMIKLAVEPLIRDPKTGCVTLARKISVQEAQDKNTVKVVFDENHKAMFFSREPIPSIWMGDKVFPYYGTVAVMPYTRKALELYARLPSSRLEIIESIDMLRFLEQGHSITVVESPFETYSVDVPQDVVKVERVMKKDPLLAVYS